MEKVILRSRVNGLFTVRSIFPQYSDDVMDAISLSDQNGLSLIYI